MSENKDFLSQFSGDDKKPDSFKEETLIPVQKPKREIKPAMIIIPLLVLLALGILSYFLFFAPKIEMRDFVGQSKNEVAAFVRQQEIDTSGIVFKEEYSMDYDADIIMSQSVEAGKKIKKNEKIDFTISLGPNPEEKISVPDINTMTKTELEDWIKKNKLQKTKITTAFSDTVPEGEVISYDLKGDADNFTRGTTLNITVSKGQAPAGQVAVEDFKGKTQYEVDTWAKSKKVKVQVVENYSDTVAAGQIISQTPAGGTSMKEGDTITIYVSKGKGVRVPDFTNMGTNQIDGWAKQTGVVVDQSRCEYSNKTQSVLYQSKAPGTMITSSDFITVTKNCGQYFYVIDEIPEGLIGNHYDRLVDTLNSLRPKGIDAYADNWNTGNEVYSDKPRGTILSVICRGNGDDKTYDCGGQLPLDVRFDVTISRGRKATVENNKTVYELVAELNGTGFAQFTLDSNIKYEDYSKDAQIADQYGNPIGGDTVDILEDKIYKIILK